MKKLLRILAWVIGVAVLLLVIAAVVVPLVVDPNDYKDELARAVEKHTGRKLTMEGDLELSVFPWLAVEIGPTRLANAPGFSDRPFAAVKQVSIRLKLLPLLRRQVEMDTVVLDGLRLSLETRADGTNNWADLTATQGAQTEPAAREPGGAGGPALAGLAIGGVAISDAAVVYDDKQTNAHYSVGGLDLRLGAIAPGATVPVSASMQLDVAEPAVKGPLKLTGQVTLSDNSERLTLAGVQLDTDLKGDGLPGGALDAQVNFDAVFDLQNGTLEAPELVAQLPDLKLRAAISAKQLFTQPAINADLRAEPFSPHKLLQGLGVALPPSADATVLDQADASLKLAAGADSVQISDLRVKLDDSNLSGSLGVSRFAKPVVRFKLKLDAIDADRYLPPPAEEPAAPVTPTAAAAAGAELFPVETLRNLDVDGTLSVERLKISRLTSRDIVLKLNGKGGQLRLHPAQAKLYGGRYEGNLGLDVRGAQPKISLDEKLIDVHMGPLLKDYQGEDTLTGKTRAHIALTTSGQTTEALKKHLNGNLDFGFTDGAVKGFNLAALIRRAAAQIKGQPAPAEDGPNQTDFSEMTGTATIADGVISNRDLLAKSPLLRVQGEGKADLIGETLDYLLTAKVVGSLEGQGGKGLDEVKGIAIPVGISGSFAKPKFQVRLDKVLKETAGKEIKQKLEKKLEKKFGDQFKGLFQ